MTTMALGKFDRDRCALGRFSKVRSRVRRGEVETAAPGYSAECAVLVEGDGGGMRSGVGAAESGGSRCVPVRCCGVGSNKKEALCTATESAITRSILQLRDDR